MHRKMTKSMLYAYFEIFLWIKSKQKEEQKKISDKKPRMNKISHSKGILSIHFCEFNCIYLSTFSCRKMPPPQKKTLHNLTKVFHLQNSRTDK